MSACQVQRLSIVYPICSSRTRRKRNTCAIATAAGSHRKRPVGAEMRPMRSIAALGNIEPIRPRKWTFQPPGELVISGMQPSGISDGPLACLRRHGDKPCHRVRCCAPPDPGKMTIAEAQGAVLMQLPYPRAAEFGRVWVNERGIVCGFVNRRGFWYDPATQEALYREVRRLGRQGQRRRFLRGAWLHDRAGARPCARGRAFAQGIGPPNG